jgi:hypothetical protein
MWRAFRYACVIPSVLPSSLCALWRTALRPCRRAAPTLLAPFIKADQKTNVAAAVREILDDGHQFLRATQNTDAHLPELIGYFGDTQARFAAASQSCGDSVLLSAYRRKLAAKSANFEKDTLVGNSVSEASLPSFRPPFEPDRFRCVPLGWQNLAP